MAESIFTHLINIVFQSSGASQTEQEVKKTTEAIDNAMGAVNKNVPQTASKLNDFQKALQRVAIVVPIWTAARMVFQSVFKLFREQTKFLVDMENAMARIKIVGQGTTDEFNNLKFALIGLSLAYGTSASEALKAAQIFAQQGKTVSETFLLTRAAMVGAQVLGEDVTAVVESLTATMKAFNIPAQNAISIIDQIINVERQFAVTSVDLASGIKTVGASANQVGVSLAALQGDITAVIEVTRKSGSEAARGLQFIYARLLTTAKPVIEQLTGINFYLDEQGKSTNALTGHLRSASDILDELAAKWNTLTNEEKLEIAQSTGSKRQLVVMNALMQNYTHSIDARIAALTSAGASERALAIVQDTVAFKTKQMTASWNALTATIADTSAFKGFLDQINFAIVSYTKLIDFEKGTRIEMAKESGALLANIETRQNQINSIEELIKVRNKLMSAPENDQTTKRLSIINEAIDRITKNNPSIKLALDTGNQNELKKSIKDMEDRLLIEKVVVQVGVDFIPKLADLEKRKQEIFGVDNIYKKAIESGLQPEKLKQLNQIEDERKVILKQQKEEIQKQLSLAKAEKVQQNISDDEEELSLSKELTSEEKEQLEISRELNNFKILNNVSTEEQIQKEIELVRNSKSIYDAHEKVLKLAQLENNLIDARLQKREEERSKLAALALQYDKADVLEKDRIKRATELMKLSPTELANTFENDLFNKNIIIDYWSSFTKEGQRAIEDTIMRLNDFPSVKTDFDLQMESIDKLNQLKKTGLTNLGGIGTSIGTGISNSPIFNNDTLIQIQNISGAIDNEGLQRILTEIENKIKSSPSYVDGNVVDQIIEIISKDESKQTRLGKEISDKI